MSIYTPGSGACPEAIVTTTGPVGCTGHGFAHCDVDCPVPCKHLVLADHGHDDIILGWDADHPHAYRADRAAHDPCPTCDGKKWIKKWSHAKAGSPGEPCPDCTDGWLHDAYCPCQPPPEMIGVGTKVAHRQRPDDLHIVIGVRDGRGSWPIVPMSPPRPHVGGLTARDFTREGGWQVLRWVPPMPEVTS